MAEQNSIAPQAEPSQMDNLHQIHGIGEAVAQRLHGAGVHTYAQLAEMTHQDLYELVKGSRPGLNLKKLEEEDWPAQARAFLAAADAQEMAAAADGQHYASFTIELLLEADNRVRRTTITHTGSGERLPMPGWDVNQVLGFMGHHADLRSAAPAPSPILVMAPPQDVAVPAEPEPAPAPVIPMAQPAPALAVEAAAAREVGGAAPSIVIPASRDWILGLEWTLSDAHADVLDEEWLVEVYLESMGPGQEYAVPSTGPAIKPLREYSHADPAAGIYRYAHELGVPASAVAAGRYMVVPTICPADPAGKLGSLTGFGRQTMLCLSG